MDNIEGNVIAKRALAIALAGKHHIILWGPVGSGKSMLAYSAKELCPLLNTEDAIERLSINFLETLETNESCIDSLRQINVRGPHHSASYAGMVGGTKGIGEITKAHKGILILDEIAEFDIRTLESLRQPLEEKIISISRAGENIQLPCDFLLIGTMNPCPCGFKGSIYKTCECHPYVISKYHKKISQPLIERVAVWVHMEHLHEKRGEGHEMRRSETEKNVVLGGTYLKQKINNVREKLKTGIELHIQKEAREILDKAVANLHLSKRVANNTISVAKTIALYDHKNHIDTYCMLEALQYRSYI